jgi:hypothetical protein
MELKGSCHCGAVKFRLVTHTPQPYMRCYCSICRKTAGGGGYAINIMGEAASLKVTGRAALSVYRARINGKLSQARRQFCGKCGSALWVQDPRWPEWVYPFASAIDNADTPLPKPGETQHIMLDSAASWVDVPSGKHHLHFDGYPEEAIIDWHTKRGLNVP